MVRAGTAERIASAALSILLAEGAEAVSMRRVAAGGGVPALGPQPHYPKPEGPLRSVADAALANLTESWGKWRDEPTFETRLDRLTDDFLDFALGQPNLYTFVVTERRELVRRFPEDFRAADSPAFGPVLEVVEQGMRDRVLRSDDPLEVALAITMSTVGLVQMYHGGRINLPEPDFRALCKRTIERTLDGLRP